MISTVSVIKESVNIIRGIGIIDIFNSTKVLP